MNRQDEDLAVSDASFRPGSSNLGNRLDGPLQEIVVDSNFSDIYSHHLGLALNKTALFMTSVNFQSWN